MKKKYIDWNKIKQEYENTPANLRQLADKYKLKSYPYLRQKAADWKKKNIEVKNFEKEIIEEHKNEVLQEHKAEIVNLYHNRKYINQQLLQKLNNIISGTEQVTNIQLKAMDMMAKYSGFYEKDNQQRNPYGGLSQEEINEKLRAKMKELGFGR